MIQIAEMIQKAKAEDYVGPRAKGKKPKATVWGKLLICELQGKRKTNTKITVSSGCSPAMDCSPTGCSQGLIPNSQIPTGKPVGIISCILIGWTVRSFCKWSGAW